MPTGDISDKICFKSRIDIELLICMFVLNHWENQVELINSKKVLVDDGYIEMLTSMYAKIPNYLKQELQYFFSDDELAWGFIGYEYKQDNVASIPEMLDIIKTQNEAELFSDLVESYLYFNVSDEQVWLSVREASNGIEDMLDIVKKTDVQNKKVQQKILEILENHIVIKQRFYLLISNFYGKVFEPEKEKIMSILEQGRERYRMLFEQDPEFFVKFYLKMGLDGVNSEFVIHTSYFLAAGYLTINPGYWKSTCALFGIFNDINMVHENKKQKETVQDFYRMLSDKTRFDIICALSGKSHYNQELAEKLGVSPSTINHHIYPMYELDIVSFQRIGHRVYYVLKKDTLKNLLDQGTQYILGKI